ncbi:hypothetical protein RBSWK_00047 [Rhodopirellula baltica SWK14]|uniref:Uncharacterized protein n=1 Tax=Rhodopirellula baltica SWK14 TaxID=993516 RepID=L7CPX3_RHOBT|nr:hypothetical protein RBSWK_00047 [Rhodopirellula baltica SWK14]
MKRGANGEAAIAELIPTVALLRKLRDSAFQLPTQIAANEPSRPCGQRLFHHSDNSTPHSLLRKFGAWHAVDLCGFHRVTIGGERFSTFAT